MHHELKIQDIHYKNKKEGNKLFEIRNNHDRGFQKGDTVSYIRDYQPFKKYDLYTQITYVTNYQQKENTVVFGENIIEEPILPYNKDTEETEGLPF